MPAEPSEHHRFKCFAAVDGKGAVTAPTASSPRAASCPHSLSKGWVVCGARGKGCPFPLAAGVSHLPEHNEQDNAHRTEVKGLQGFEEHSVLVLIGMAKPPLQHLYVSPGAAGTQKRAGFGHASQTDVRFP